MHENNCMETGEYEIWLAWQPSSPKPVAEPEFVESSPEKQLRLCVKRSYARHSPGAGLAIKGVNHDRLLLDDYAETVGGSLCSKKHPIAGYHRLSA